MELLCAKSVENDGTKLCKFYRLKHHIKFMSSSMLVAGIARLSVAAQSRSWVFIELQTSVFNICINVILMHRVL